MKRQKVILLLLFFSKICFSNAISHYAYNILTTLSLQEKIGQLFIVSAIVMEEGNEHIISKKSYRMDQQHIEYLITEYNIGGIIWLGNSVPEKQITLTNHYQNINSSNKIPLWFAQDLEPGFMHRFGLPHMPYARELGETNDQLLAKEIGEKIGELAYTMGVDIVLAPVVDIHTNQQNSITFHRSFGSDQCTVTKMAHAFIQGLKKFPILTCLKHFPGHGATTTDSHDSLPIITQTMQEWHTTDLYPYETLINTGYQDAIMIGHIAYPALTHGLSIPSTFSRIIIHDILKHKLNFQGLIISDALDMLAIKENITPEIDTLCAGTHILLCPNNIEQALISIEKSIKSGTFSERTLNEYVLKILEEKLKLIQTKKDYYA